MMLALTLLLLFIGEVILIDGAPAGPPVDGGYGRMIAAT